MVAPARSKEMVKCVDGHRRDLNPTRVNQNEVAKPEIEPCTSDSKPSVPSTKPLLNPRPPLKRMFCLLLLTNVGWVDSGIPIERCGLGLAGLSAVPGFAVSTVNACHPFHLVIMVRLEVTQNHCKDYRQTVNPKQMEIIPQNPPEW